MAAALDQGQCRGRMQLAAEAIEHATDLLREQLGQRLGQALVDFQSIGRHTNSVGLAGLLFHRADLLERYGGQRSTILPIPEVAVRLGVKQEVAYALANLGLLEVEMYTCGRRQAQGVSTGSLETFHTVYVLAANVAKSLGRSSRAVIKALTDDAIEPIASPALGNCRQTVYLRKDLETVPWLATGSGSKPNPW